MTPGTYTLPAAVRGDTWPGIATMQRWVRGEALAGTANAATDAITALGHGLVDDDAVILAAAAAGLEAGAIYYVTGATSDTFQLAASAGGEALALTTGAVTVYPLEAPATPVASARMQFRLDATDGPLVLALTSEPEGGLVIDDAAAWVFSVPARTPGFPRAGTLYWDLECTDDDGAIETWVTGTIEVQADVSR